jgi:L-ribulokinase
MNKRDGVALGLDFGTESVRALLVDLAGNVLALAVAKFEHGQITRTMPVTGESLPPDFAFQHPADWLNGAAKAVRRALKKGNVDTRNVIGIGVDFTSCTMLPAADDGTPLCLTKRFEAEKFAWPKLWKHHGAKSQTDRFNEIARRRKEPWLDRYGGTIGLEWFFPKALETLENAPDVYSATEIWLEAGDWFVWQLVGGPAETLPRSTCQAGYKALWNRSDGYPSTTFLKAVHPKLADMVSRKMPGRLLAPGQAAGELCARMAKRMGLHPGTLVSAATIDAHAGVPGAGAAECGTLVMVMGTSSCHMLNAKQEKPVPGVAGVVEDGILPGCFGYETGQAAVGDAFDWLRRTLGHVDFTKLTLQAAALPPGADGILCIDWLNGCRTPLMDGTLRGAFLGLGLHHGGHHFYRALLEASAFGLRWIVDLLREGGVPVKKFVATGGLPRHNRLLLQIYADVLGEPITIADAEQGPALGAAILGAVAAGTRTSGFSSPAAAIRAMASTNGRRKPQTFRPLQEAHRAYKNIYQRYRAHTDELSRAV